MRGFVIGKCIMTSCITGLSSQTFSHKGISEVNHLKSGLWSCFSSPQSDERGCWVLCRSVKFHKLVEVFLYGPGFVHGVETVGTNTEIYHIVLGFPLIATTGQTKSTLKYACRHNSGHTMLS